MAVALKRNAQLVKTVEAEYREMPGLSLSKPQLRRLWSIDAETCDALEATLEAEGFLKRTRRDCYVRIDSGR